MPTTTPKPVFPSVMFEQFEEEIRKCLGRQTHLIFDTFSRLAKATFGHNNCHATGIENTENRVFANSKGCLYLYSTSIARVCYLVNYSLFEEPVYSAVGQTWQLENETIIGQI